MRLATLPLLALLAFMAMIAPAWAQDDLAIERDPQANTPVRNPLKAWREASLLLAEGIVIRRLAFASHGLFVFYSPAQSEEIQADFFSWLGGELSQEDGGPRPSSMCAAPGVSVSEVGPALQQLLTTAVWKTHQAKMDTLALECFGERLYWSLIPVPEGGYVAGVAIPTYDSAFEAGPDSKFNVE